MSQKTPEQVALERIEEAQRTGARSLYLRYLNLTALPDELWQFTNLTSLHLSGNQLTALPGEIGQFTNLTSLCLSGNQLTTLPAEIGQLTKLASFKIYNNKLTALPCELWQLTNLTSLDLSNNQLTALPGEIGQLINLTSLDLSGNQLAALPGELWQLTNLTLLDLSSNRLTALPCEIGHLANLTSLDLASNQLTALPGEIGHLANLTSLDISSNRLTALPGEIGHLTNLTSLDLSSNQLTALPGEIGQLTNITSLSIPSNKLTALPGELWQLANLAELNLLNNRLTALPGETGQLTNLTKLDLSINQLAALPGELWQLTKLTKLNLSNNQLTTLSGEIGQLTDLTELSLSYNQLTVLPVEIGQLTNLTSLSISGSKLTALPGEIGQLTNLTRLYISNNQLTALPGELAHLKKLTQLNLQANPLPIPPEIIEKTGEPQTMLEYYFSILGKYKKPLGETKLIFVGQGSVGKTSIIRRLLGGGFDAQETKTDGIAIQRWQVDDQPAVENTNPKIVVNIWDFGGQEIMHATHQFFLTRRSLYLLVLDARLTQEENRVEYWLKIIQSYGGDSPILIVGNKVDQHPLDIDRTGLRKKYPAITGILETSAATGQGIDGLRAVIARQVNALPHVRDLLPETWFAVKARLEGLGRATNYITHERYLELCAENRVDDASSQRTLIGFLHDLGVVLHFQDDPRLEALGILNPQWVTNGVYKILNAHALFQSKGELQRPMLDEILADPAYPPNKRLFIVDMMRKFELCYDIVPDQTFLVPDLLPKDEPYTGEWAGALAFQYHYNVLPSSIISRFIVRMNALIYKTVWRAGVVLKQDGNTALVKADTEERKIYVWVCGDENTRRDMLSTIRSELGAIHRTIVRLEAVQKVPYPSYPDLVFDYAELLQFERNGIAEFPKPVDGRILMINVRQLLNGMEPESQRRQPPGSITHIHTGGNVVIAQDHAVAIGGNANNNTINACKDGENRE